MLYKDIQKAVVELVLADEDVTALHEMKTRQSGHTQFIQLHVEMNGDMTLKEAHDVSERLMKELEFLYPSAEIIIHQDPHNDAVADSVRLTSAD